MILSDVAIRRPVFAIVVSLLLVVLGLFAAARLTVREYPNIDPPVVSISTIYEGASAQVVESQITEVVEGAVSGISGLRTIRSSSREGLSTVRLEFNLGRPLEEATNDTRDAIGRILRALPDTVDQPVIRKIDSDASPVMYLTVTSDSRSAVELTDYVERNIVDRFATVAGVAQVNVNGGREYAMRIWLDRDAMAARGVTAADVNGALQAQNVELPAGRVESQQRELTVRMDSTLATPTEFAKVVIREDGDVPIRLGDIARVETGPRDTRGGFRLNGTAAIGIGIAKQSDANTLQVGTGVRAALALVQPTLPPDISMVVSSDDSIFIEASIGEVEHALLIALALVVGIVLVFLRSFRATLIPAVAVPVSIIATAMVLAALGFSINVLTLLAMVLAIGLVVDDAIIVLENVSRRIEFGEPPLVAATLGSRQIGFAVIATTLVLVAVFVPISFLEGNVGRLFREFGISVAAAVLFSALVALTLTPMMCSRLLRPQAGKGWLMRVTEPPFRALDAGYRALLRGALAVPIVIAAVAMALAVAAGLLLTRLPSEFVPTEDRGRVVITATGPEGSSTAYTTAQAVAIEGALAPYMERGDIQRLLSIVTTNAFGGGAAGGSINRVTVIAPMRPWSERAITQQDLVRDLTGILARIPGIRAVAINPSGLSRGSSAPVRFVIGGDSYEQLAEWRDRLIERLSDARSIRNLQADYDETKPEVRVSIDRDRAADLGISIRTIAETLETMVAGTAATQFNLNGTEYDVMVQAREEDRRRPRDLSNIFVRSGDGALVPLTSLIAIEDTAGPGSLGRFDRLRAVGFIASLGDGATLGQALDEVQAAVSDVLPPEARLSWDGESRDLREGGAALYMTFATALVVVYLVLAAQFESFVHPFTILLTVPLALFGALASAALSGVTINIYTQIGMVMLIGLTAKNAILIVEFANQLSDDGASIHEAVVEAAATRLRPILMTSIATVFGAVPLALATGAGAESRQAIGVVIVGGVSVSTLLSLFLVPVVWRWLAPFTRPAGHATRELAALLRRHPPGGGGKHLPAA
jgi:multidrug efflux pump